MPSRSKKALISQEASQPSVVREPLVVVPQTRVIDAIAQMSKARAIDRQSEPYLESHSCCLVLENAQVVGIFTRSDLVRLIAQQQLWEHLTMGQVMSSPVVTMYESTLKDLHAALQLLQHHHISHLPILNEQKHLVGLFTRSSLVNALNPEELYPLLEIQERKIVDLEIENLDLLDNGDHKLEERNIAPINSLESQLERERLVSQIANRIRLSLDLQVVLDASVTEIRAFLRCDRVLVYQFQPDWSGVVIAESVDQALGSALGNSINDSCFQSQTTTLYSSEQPIAVNDIYAMGYTSCHIQLLEQYQVKANLVVPIHVAGKLWGLLIGHQCATQRDWQASDVALLQTISVQLAIAIQQATMHQLLQEELNERVKTEIRLRQSEQRYASLTKAASVGIFRASAAGNCTYVNERYCQLTGLTPEQAMGKGWQNGLHPEDRERVIAECYQAVQENRPFCLEYRFLHPNGKTTWVYGQSAAELDEAGEFIGCIVTLTDISDRKRSEEALRNSEAHQRALISALPDLLIRINRAGVYLEFRPNSNSRVVGNIAEMIGSHVSESLPPNLAERRLNYIRLALETNSVQMYEQDLSTPEKLQIEEVRVVPYTDDEVLLLVRDITERKLAEYERQQTEQQLQDLVEGTAANTGKSFFPALVQHIAQALQVPYVIVSELVGNTLHSLAVVMDGELYPNLYYEIDNTPCQQTLQQGKFSCVSSIQQQFPEDPLLHQLAAESYLGIALQDAQGNVIGVLCIIDERPLQTVQRTEKLLRIFAARAGAELEREKVMRALESLNIELESRVQERTAALLASEERWQLALKGANDGIWDWDMITNRVFYSERWKAMRGFTEEDEVSDRLEEWLDNIHPEDLHRVMDAVSEHFRGRTAFYKIEYRVRHKNGDYIWILDRGRALWNESGQVVRMIGSESDVTDLKLAEMALRESEEKFRQLAEVVDAVFWILSLDRAERIYVSPAYERIWGRKAINLHITPDAWLDAIHPEDRDRVIAAIPKQMQGEFDEEYRIIRHDNEVRWIRDRAFPIKNERGEVYRIAGIAEDITEQKKAESVLQENERFIQQIADASPNILYVFDVKNQRNIYVNREIATILGYTPAEIQAMGELFTHNLMHPDDLDRLSNYFQRLTEATEGEIVETEYRMRHVNGEWRWLYSRDVVFKRDAEGRVEQVVGTAQDISDRKYAESRLYQQANRERLNSAITQRIRASLNLQDILNTTVEEVRQVLQSERVLVYRILPDTSGQVIAESVYDGFSSLLNQTFSKEVFPPENYERYVRGRIFALNDRETDPILSCLANFLCGIHVRAELVVPIIQNKQLWGLLIAHHCSAPCHWETWEIDLLRQLSGQLAIAIKQSELYAQLQNNHSQLTQVNAELMRATRLKDEFLANMSHELRTPLNAILGMTEGLQEQIFGSVNEQQVKALQTIERSGSHLLELINDILDVAKIESGQMELDCTPTAIAPLCQASLTFIKQQAVKKRIQIETRIPANLPLLFIDERRIRQVLINLLTNAVKFTPEGGHITLEIGYHSAAAIVEPPPLQGITRVSLIRASSAKERLSKDAYLENEAQEKTINYIRIAVIDTGIGIATEHMDKLFQPFIQIDSALNRRYQGTGLGLALVKRIVELHNGQVGVTSQVGIGSCFNIDLPYHTTTQFTSCPASESDPNDAPTPTNDVPTLTEPLSPRQILLVEDNEANIRTISGYLKAKGYQILTAKNGYEALTAIQNWQPHLILMDVQMPDMEGLEAIQQIRREPQFANVPIVALTALTMAEEDRERCLATGANDYLSKPVKLKQLTDVIQKLLAVHKGIP